ncbi:cytochrome ubiquinol oxidase subunit I [candidate division KSB1 bacterium]|nr:cytochrome ubiquinol oxidase subunit I [candidate division KSB1 bacterium]RQW01539.1 MAG: cytochrome ubiquinol oxidase subunit I [candidate division KSB1 bacterium]
MDALLLARCQFAVTTVYHFFFVPLTLGLSILVAIMETIYVKTGNEAYKRMAKFWGVLFLINFAMGVVTGIVQEFQFGMNWSEYSRFVGDIFGAPLAIEALLAFFLESTFLGVWIFGWNRLSPKMHAASMWIVAFGSNLSALWILIANSFMQQPVGYTIRNGRAEMIDFFALLKNGHVWVQFPHVFFAGICTAAFFVIGISAYHLMKKSDDRFVWQQSMKIGTIYGAIGVILVMLIGHSQAQYMMKVQPMKMAAAEALWESENPAAMSLFTIGNEKKREDVFALKVPGLLSFLAYNRFSGEVKGINQLQMEYEESHGPANYVPPVAISYWTFRIMVGAGMVMLLLIVFLLVALFRNKFDFKPIVFGVLLWAIALPYLANTTGWIFTEIARQPWAVFGVLRTEAAVSPSVSGGAVLLSLVLFTLVYGALMVADIYLLRKHALAGTAKLNFHE